MQIIVRVEVDANSPVPTGKRNTVTVECGSVVVVVDSPEEEPMVNVSPAAQQPAQPLVEETVTPAPPAETENAPSTQEDTPAVEPVATTVETPQESN